MCVQANKQLGFGGSTTESRCVRVDGVGSNRFTTADNIQGQVDGLEGAFQESANSEAPKLGGVLESFLDHVRLDPCKDASKQGAVGRLPETRCGPEGGGSGGGLSSSGASGGTKCGTPEISSGLATKSESGGTMATAGFIFFL